MKERAENRPKPARNPLANQGFAAALLAVSVFILYWPATKFEFTRFDDLTYYVENSHVQGGLSPAGAVWAFTTGTASNWHPLTWLSHMLDVEFSEKLDPGVPHFTNILLHAANSALLFLLLQNITGTRWRSLFVAALFALHPLNVESVAWVSERKNVLSTFFWWLTLFAYARFIAEKKQGTAKTSFWRSRKYQMTLGFFALGLMSKPMLVTLPFTLLLLDVWPFRRTTIEGWRMTNMKYLLFEKWPFFMMSAAACVVTFAVQQHGKAVQSLQHFSPSVRVANALVSYCRYLEKTFWPVDLAVIYPYPAHWPTLQVLLYAAVLLAFTVFALTQKKAPWMIVGWCWFLGTLVPVIGLIQVGNQSMADRYAYVPLVGIFIIVAWAGYEMARRLKIPKSVLFGAAVMLLLGCAAQTRHQLGYWQNDGTLFSHALSVDENNAYAHTTLGVYLEKMGDRDGAYKNYRASEALDPEEKNARYNLGNLLDDMGKPDEAIKEYREAIRIDPSLFPAHYNLGLLLARLGRRDEAIEEFTIVLKYQPGLDAARQQLRALGVVTQ